MERKAQVKDYNYARVRRVLAETGQLKDNVSLKERKKQEESLDSFVDKEEVYNYKLAKKQLNIK